MTRIRLAFTVTVLAFAASAFAQTPPVQTPPKPPTSTTPQNPPPLVPPKPAVQLPFPPDAKIAFVSMQTVVSESQLGKAGQKTMQDLQNKKAAEMADKAKKIDALKNEIQSQQSVLSPTALQAKTTELDKLQREAQFAQQDAQAEVDNLNQQLLNNFQEKVLPILDAIRNEKNLWVIFSVQESGAAVWNPAIDMSMEVVKRLDAIKK